MSGDRIRIVHLVDTLGGGGIENGLVNLANRFDHSAFDFAIWCVGTRGVMADRITAPAVEVRALGHGDGWHLEAAVSMARMLRRSRTDILHCHGWGGYSLVGLLAARLGRTPRCINGEHGGSHNLLTRRQLTLQRLIADLFDGTVAPSDALRQKLHERRGLRPERVTLLPNGVDTERFCGRRCSPPKRAELGIADSDWLVAVVGTLKPEKNQRIVIEALARLPQSDRYHLALVGIGPDRATLEEAARALGVAERVHFLGYRNDVADLLAEVDTLVLPSIPAHEAMSNVLLEAMSSGVPVVTSECVGARELVDPGRTGLLFDYLNPRELAEHLTLLRTDTARRAEIVARAREVVRTSFSLDTMVRRYQDFYRYVLRCPQGQRPVAMP